MASVRVKYALGVVLVVVVSVVGAVGLSRLLGTQQDKSPAKLEPVAEAAHDALSGEPASIRADASDLRGTVVTPHLECAITGDKNVLWCATFQIAWNELCDLLGGPVQCPAAQEMADALNKKAVTRADVDEASCVAMAGYPTGGPDDILDRIAAALKDKFAGAASPELLPSRQSVPRDAWIAYAYLFKQLPFEWAFERMRRWRLTFAGRRVESFGIYQLYSAQANEVKAAGQVLIHDYRDGDDFIIEVKTRSRADRLILAKIQPAGTLSATILAIQQRLASSTPHNMMEMSSLLVPVLDFDVVQNYRELSAIGTAIQQIRFRLDETGAVLKSEAVAVKARSEELIFDKPFLVMIQKGGSQNPYFALWVANAELLAPLHE
jgi:hypothetical protein